MWLTPTNTLAISKNREYQSDRLTAWVYRLVLGAFLIWKFGLPASIERSGAVHLIAEQRDEEEVKLAKKYDFRSSVGFWLIILSFLFQLASNFL
jgi:hypothetical protein